MAQSNAEKQAAFRARKAADSETEVRGIYAKPELHDKIKSNAKRIKKAADKP